MKRIGLASICVCALLAGCSWGDKVPGWLTPYRPDVHQGNVVTSEMLESLHEGMTKNQVIFLLGSPTLRSVFHENEWDYTYYLNPRMGDIKIRHMKVIFDEDGRVESFNADVMPDETDADLQILGERARADVVKKRLAEKKQAESLGEVERDAEKLAEEHPNTVETETFKEPVTFEEPAEEELAEEK